MTDIMPDDQDFDEDLELDYDCDLDICFDDDEAYFQKFEQPIENKIGRMDTDY